MKVLLPFACSVLLLLSCKQAELSVIDGTAPALNEDSLVRSTTGRVLGLLRDGAYVQLADYVHPVKGIRFSPYGYIDSSNVHFTADAFRRLVTDAKDSVLYWGAYDGSGEEIRMNFADYAHRFVYDVPFLVSGKTVVNEFVGGGNTINNLRTFYSDNFFTETFVSGTDPALDDMDWRSLRLVYKLTDGKIYLVGIVHDQWTI